MQGLHMLFPEFHLPPSLPNIILAAVPDSAGASPEFRGIRAPRALAGEPPPLTSRPLPRLRCRQRVQVRDGHLAVPFQCGFCLQLHPGWGAEKSDVSPRWNIFHYWKSWLPLPKVA